LSTGKRLISNLVIAAGSVSQAIGFLAITKWNTQLALSLQFEIENGKTYPRFELQAAVLYPYVLTCLLYIATAFFCTRHVLRYRVAIPLNGLRIYSSTALFTGALAALTLYPFLGLYAGYLVIFTASTGYLVATKKLFKNG